MVIEKIYVLDPNVTDAGKAHDQMTVTQLTKLAKCLISSQRVDYENNGIVLYGQKSMGVGFPLGVKPPSGNQIYSSAGRVSNYQIGNIFCGLAVGASTATSVEAYEALENLAESFVSELEGDLKNYRVIRFLQKIVDATDASFAYGVLVLGKLSQKTTDSYTPFDGVTVGANKLFTVLDASYLDVNAVNQFFVAGFDVPGSMIPKTPIALPQNVADNLNALISAGKVAPRASNISMTLKS